MPFVKKIRKSGSNFIENLNKEDDYVEQIDDDDNYVESTKTYGNDKHKSGLIEKICDWIIFSSIFLIFFGFPLFFTGQTAAGIGFEKTFFVFALLLLGLIAWVTKGLIAGKLLIKRTPIDIPLLILLTAYLLSTIFSVDKITSLIGPYGSPAKGFAIITGLALFYWLLVNNLSAKKIKWFFLALVSSSCLVIIYSLLQLIGVFILPINFTKTSIFNTIGSSTSLSFFISSVIPILIIASAGASIIFPKILNKRIILVSIKTFIIYILLLAVLLLAILNNFTFWPAILVGVIMLLMFGLAKIIEFSRVDTTIPITIFLLLILFIVLGNVNLIKVKLPTEIGLSKKFSWQIAKNTIKANPILGTGPGTFVYDFSKFKDKSLNNTNFWNVKFNSPSGFLFELTATTGALGLLSALIVILIILSFDFLAIIKTKEKEIQPILLAFYSSLIILGIDGALYSFSNTIILLTIIIAFLTTAIASYIYQEEPSIIKLSLRTSPKYALALASIFLFVSASVVVLIVMAGKMYWADHYALKANTSHNLDNGIRNYNKAISLVDYQAPYWLNLSQIYMAKVNQETKKQPKKRNNKIIQANLYLAINSAKKSIELAPNMSNYYENAASIYENAAFYAQGAIDWAEEYYGKFGQLEPNNPLPNLHIAMIKMTRANVLDKKKDKDKIKSLLKQAIKNYKWASDKKQNLASAYYGEGIAYEKLKMLNEAINSLRKANFFARNNLNYRFELARLYFNRGVEKLNEKSNKKPELSNIPEIKNDNNGTSTENVIVEKNYNNKEQSNTKINNDLKLAEMYLVSILQRNKNYANARYTLALLYERVGKNNLAKENYEKLLKILPEGKVKNSIEEKIKSL